jgi:hypothetical protein
LYLVALVCLAFGRPSAFAGTFTITLKVVDADKKPVAQADAALFWNVKDGAMSATGEKTAADGKTVLRVDDWNEKRPLLVLSADRKLGGIVGVSKDDDGKEVSVVLGPTIRLKGRLECKELNNKPAWANATVTADGFRAFFTQDFDDGPAFTFILPAGRYKLVTYGTDVEDAKQEVNLTADKPERDLGALDLKASPIAKFKGAPPPEWVVTDARGVKSDVKLSDYKGKWVYVEFWGFW